jgi:formylglycine-generating enzyme required for sulfatase activity
MPVVAVVLGACGAPTGVATVRPTTAPMSLTSDDHMIVIPAGRYISGSTPEERASAFEDYASTADPEVAQTRPPFDQEADRHNSILPAFRIDLMPVTQAAFAEFVIEAHATPPAVDPAAPPEVQDRARRFAWVAGRPPNGREDHPVVLVAWTDARSYCVWRGQQLGAPRRLPTAEELEKATRGDNGLSYPWGNLFESKKLNSAVGGPGDTTPVGTYTAGASPYGVLDLAGNVLEWSATPAPGDQMMATGSAFDEPAGVGRGASRHAFAKTTRMIELGFRCAGDAPEP